MLYVFKGILSQFTDFYTIVITFNLTNKKYIKPLVLHVDSVLSVSPESLLLKHVINVAITVNLI